eukprot:m51a1_g4785 hypothetical protein (105) ;mRNA; f:60431-61027
METQQLLHGLSQVREALLRDKQEAAATAAQLEEARAEIARLRSGAGCASSDEVTKLREENALLKATVDRLNYRVYHLCQSLDAANKASGLHTIASPPTYAPASQ